MNSIKHVDFKNNLENENNEVINDSIQPLRRFALQRSLLSQDPLCTYCDEQGALKYQLCAKDYGNACEKDTMGNRKDISCCMRIKMHKSCLSCASYVVNGNLVTKAQQHLKMAEKNAALASADAVAQSFLTKAQQLLDAAKKTTM